MRPILLKGHERSITFLKFNHDGDLLFTAAKDYTPTAWRAENGERLGTYDGHTGAVWALDVSRDSKLLITGSADNTARLWNVRDGQELHSFRHSTPVRSVAIALGSKHCLTVTDALMGFKAAVHVYAIADDPAEQEDLPVLQLWGEDRVKITQALWGPLNESIITSHDDGAVRLWQIDWKAEGGPRGECVATMEDHAKAVNSIQLSEDGGLLVTGSSDCSARLYDARTLAPMRSYETDRPVNAAAISPGLETVLVGGGQEAAAVTTTSTRVGKFQCIFFDAALGDMLFTVKGHFGPINAVAFRPDGSGFASGSEDGYVRLHVFDPDYWQRVQAPQPPQKTETGKDEAADAGAEAGGQ